MSKLEKIFFIPDCHIPYHDKKAFEIIHKVAKDFKPDHTVILGDFADFFDVSSHSKEPTRRFKLDEELEAVEIELAKIAKWTSKNKVFIEGNHENRMERYLRDKAPELYNLISIPKILKLEKYGFSYTKYKESYILGKLSLTHDAGKAGRYAVQKALDTFQSSIIIGHLHRMSYIVEGSATGKKHISACFGWLGDKDKVDYMHKVNINKDWATGFGIGYLDRSTGFVYIVPVPIVEYTCVVEGRFYNLKK